MTGAVDDRLRSGPVIPLVLAAWLLLPNAALLTVTHIAPTQVALASALSALVLALPALAVGSARALFLLNAPLALLAGLVSAYTLLFESPVTSGLVQSVLLTDMRQAREHVAAYQAVVWLSLAGTAGYVWLASRLGARALPGRRFLAAASLWAVLVGIYAPYAAFEIFERAGVSVDTTFSRAAFPLNVLDATRTALGQRAASGQWAATPPGVAPLPSEPRRIFVLVIGESTRAATFDEVAHDTGRLSSIEGLVRFKDVLAQANFTEASVPMLLTGTRTYAEALRATSLVQWQNAAGCVTVFLSNNTHAPAADAARFRDVAGDGGITHLTRYDHELLDALPALLETTAPDHLCITLHLAGSHFDYRARYGPAFERYPVQGDETQQLRAAYANSVVMVQDFLARLIALLAPLDAQVLLLFASDHGENLLEFDGLREHVADEPTIFELQVPLVAWGNRALREAIPDRWNVLVENAGRPVSNASVTPTLLELLALSDSAYPAERSLFRPQPAGERLFVRPDFSTRSEREMRRP